jgi:hypothetical protein
MEQQGIDQKGLLIQRQPYCELEITDEWSGNKEKLKVSAFISAPRLGFTDHHRVAQMSLNTFNIPLTVTGGAWWEHAIQNTITELINGGTDILISLDYDSIFFPDDIKELLSLMVRHPDMDALVPIQLKRGNKNDILCAIEGITYYPPTMSQGDVSKIDIGHFGLTMFRSNAFKDVPKPWLMGVPNEKGDWFNGQVNPDIYFWKKFKEYNKKVCMANQVKIGHIDEYLIILDQNNQIKRYKLNDYLLGRLDKSLGE